MNDEKNALRLLRRMLEELDNQARDMDSKRENLRGTIRQLEEMTKGDSSAIESKSVLSSIPSEEAQAGAFPYQKIKGLSQTRAMVVIARHFNGILRTRDLAQILVDARIMKKTKNVSAMASRLLRTSERFERISEGLYRLKNGDHPPTNENLQQQAIPSLDFVQ